MKTFKHYIAEARKSCKFVFTDYTSLVKQDLVLNRLFLIKYGCHYRYTEENYRLFVERYNRELDQELSINFLNFK